MKTLSGEIGWDVEPLEAVDPAISMKTNQFIHAGSCPSGCHWTATTTGGLFLHLTCVHYPLVPPKDSFPVYIPMEPQNLYDLKAYLCTVALQTFALPELWNQRDISDFHKELNRVPKEKRGPYLQGRKH